MIIPIIPTINKANSGEKFIELLEKKNLKEYFSDEFIYSISKYIDDMRILKNSLNEFLLYKNRIDVNHSDNKSLFSLMLYKTLNSEDFEKIDNNDGNLYSAFAQKKIFINSKINEMNNQIKHKEHIIKRAEREILQNVDELRGAFCNVVLKKRGYSRLRIDEKRELRETDILSSNYNFEDFENFGQIIFYHERNSNLNKTFSFKSFNDTFLIDGLSYYRRYLALEKNKNQYIENIKQEINELEIKKRKIADYTLSEYLEEYGAQGVLQGDNELLIFLLREGYIKENYMRYISCFYDGKLTRADAEFILNMQNRELVDFSFNLEKKDEIINQLEMKYFRYDGILNYNLIDFLMENQDKYSKQINAVFSLISELGNRATEFIKRYFETNSYNYIEKEFIKRLCNKCDSIWNFIQYNSKYTEDKINIYLKSIITCVDINAIKKINAFSDADTKHNYSLKKYLDNKKDFILIFYSIADKEKIKKIIKELDIKFKNLYLTNQDDWLFKYIVKGNHYEINEVMLNLIIDENQDVKEEIICNYTGVFNSGVNSLIEYINSNIHVYLLNVYLNNLQKKI